MIAEVRSLQDIPRIGDKMSKRFVEHFGSEDQALDAILAGDIASISEVEGIGQRYAISLIQDVASRVEGVNVTDFLRTRESMDVYEKLLDIIKEFAHTRYSRDKLHVFFPYPGSKAEKIMQIRRSVSYYMETATVLEGDGAIAELLPKVSQLNFKHQYPKVRDRVIITSDQDSYEYARKRFAGLIDVHFTRSLSEFIDVSRGFSQVIAVGDDYLAFDFPEDVEPEFITDLQDLEDFKVVPEKEIFAFSRNLKSLESSIKAVRLLRSKGIRFFDRMDDDTLELLASTLSLIDEDGDIVHGTDEELDRITSAIERLPSCVSESVTFVNDELNSCLEKSQMTLSGQDMLKVMNGSIELKDMLGKTLHKSYHSIIKQGIEKICNDLQLEKKERLMVDSLFPEDIMHPVEADVDSLGALKQYLIKSSQKRKFNHKREVSRILSSYRELSRELAREVLDFDVGFAIGSFACTYGLVMPAISTSTGIGFKNGRNLFLLSRHGDVIPIDYSVGENSFSPEDEMSKVVLLSGVNSGGKTSLLELLAQSIILAHMGFPVPAEAMEISLTESMYYFAKSKGTLDAGAFETTLTEFSVVADESSKFVLADELESITEPGASAKIMAGILEVLSENDDTMSIFVSHLSEQIMENTTCDIRVDGIEASGLDSDLNLIVDRSPRYNYVAKSTPELIVERLSKKTKGKEQAFYDKLRSKF
ncbi:MutS-related protein [Methanolobus profundi]|uniref:DNA-binding protein MutS2 n=1 Tax=Methanolobus profundi TaxID=487685 RepID=A0A1I4R8M3_9EURY|nr:helix-hairpin-helix domain-containing protein [Methanolobus profundi]SFM48658.1 dsDNA-specific endonuclease/ATPase MutS2 [Methanolobus profundi]